ncbi:RNA 2',3'-cyclic phosphodiesterase [Paenibacillus sp. MBLB4367]|uniref:RNA 2',3'-cyclic phosphodiesterase n=1 Tax=Paenibacillus sp. MBLB4367 TaxID=3384767 RepID=UPI00390811C0
MPDMLRLFVALPLPDTTKRALQEKCEALRSRLSFQKWVHRDDYHITLKFLGDTPPQQAAKLTDALREAARAVRPFPLSLEGLGAFGPPAAPKILWAGVQGDKSALHKLQQAVDISLAKAGYAAEEKAYKPHISLARRYAGTDPLERDELARQEDAIALSRTVERRDIEPSIETPKSPLAWQASDVVLYVSHLGKTPMYEIVETFPLNQTAPVPAASFKAYSVEDASCPGGFVFP